MLEACDIHAGYTQDLHILRGVTITAQRGKVTAILGANGVGKSTLLKVIFGFLQPAQGSVVIDGDEISGTPPHRMVNRGVTYIPQQPGVFAEMTVEENVTIGAWSFRRDAALIRERLAENYERFPILADRRRAKAGELSGGQRRMIELARALMSNPLYLLVDEPSAGLAPSVSDDVYVMLQHLRDSGVALVLVEQDIPRALTLADYVYVIDLGQNLVEGTPTELGDVQSTFWQWADAGPR